MLSTDNYTQKLLGLEDVIITKVQRNLNETLIFIELAHCKMKCNSNFRKKGTTKVRNRV